jgi:hypothetical protein
MVPLLPQAGGPVASGLFQDETSPLGNWGVVKSGPAMYDMWIRASGGRISNLRIQANDGPIGGLGKYAGDQCFQPQSARIDLLKSVYIQQWITYT